MKKAVLYARVSSELQQKERTIESQIAELKRQIADAGNILVKEYTDDGFSGALMDRPALDQLRSDLKTNLFETIYFLNTDRIARDVAYQNIIIAEILKHEKQIIINGKDYIHNPENKFALTVLGAVSELERAKIIERSMRGKLHRLRQGFPLNNGGGTYGYNYIPRSDIAPAAYVINEKEARVVKYIFDVYANARASWSTIVRYLENTGALTKMGKKFWDTAKLTSILKNPTYTGIKYFNMTTQTKKLNNPLRGIKYGKRIYRDRSEWIGIKIPAIISQKIFDAAQVRLEENRQKYRNPPQTQLLSNLVKCGECGRFFTSYQRYYKKYRKDFNGKPAPRYVAHKIAYRCSRRTQQRMHSRKSDFVRCSNPEVSARLLEACVLRIFQDIVVDPIKLEGHVDYSKENTRTVKTLQGELENIEQKIQVLIQQKKQITDRYAMGNLDRAQYTKECLWYDSEIRKIQLKRKELIGYIPLLHKDEVIDMAVKQYCNSVKARLEKCATFENKRQFFLDFIEKVICYKNKITLRGSIPVKIKARENVDRLTEISEIKFTAETKINRASIFSVAA